MPGIFERPIANEGYQKLRFGDLCVKMGFMTEEQLKSAIAKKEIAQERLGKICVREGLLDEEQLAMVIAVQHYYNYVELEGPRDPELLGLIPLELMMKYQFVPYEQDGETLVIAMADPVDFVKVASSLEVLLDRPVSVVIASETRIKSLLKRLESEHNVLDSVSDGMRLSLVKESEKGEETLSLEKVTAEESPIVRLVDSTILDAINKKASDIHFESSEQGVVIRYRIDGMLHQITEPLDLQYQSQIISRIKVMSELDISEKRIPQDGRFKLKVKDRNIDFRVSILPTLFGEDAVIRILDREYLMPDSKEFRLDDMNLPETELRRIRKMIHAPYGMFLVTGPTGSGKTTTLYAAISEINNPNEKIITIEDPVEYQLKGVVQIPVNEKKGLTFARGLRSILRHDPDKILVGEIRDEETARIALQSALTGHLVFTTVHANSSFEVISRFIHMGIEPYNLISALNCIIAQRLLRVLCRCKQMVEEDEKEEYLKECGLDYEAYSSHTFFKENELGCDVCKGSGFKGRQAIIELIEMTDAVKELFLDGQSISALKREARGAGTTFLREAAMNLVLSGRTSVREANRVTFIE
ncbi:MAG: type II/IV secretion system protein [Deltaproteobacteria bacterium]|nr:type II/IV secretion system protein [Deltaproteobacteria bacterium]MBW2018085.1 type II/IV secretion system protein [Deltaproteobacteria bacterium]MBW2130216.1 type II/IV secretion system protein [Deltaproteobacteria bacterium]MBW2305154.1 type II/IV secretion system protein [Deltaproteobacteria bacterium]